MGARAQRRRWRAAMILSRVMAHVKAQNWTAIAIDFFIVVFGVFIGIQLGNWNHARADRVEERQLLTRLDDEARTLLEIEKSEYAKRLPRLEAMTAIHPLLFDRTPARAPTDLECHFIAISHYLPAPTDDLPILEEAIATGRFDLISNESVKEKLRRFAVVRDRSRRMYAEATDELFRLSPRHPNAIRAVRARIDAGDPRAQWARSAGDGYIWSAECDLEKMRSDKAFLEEYEDNMARLVFFGRRYEELIAALEDLRMRLRPNWARQDHRMRESAPNDSLLRHRACESADPDGDRRRRLLRDREFQHGDGQRRDLDPVAAHLPGTSDRDLWRLAGPILC